ncbi:MAG: phosphate/phosphite/phosphonate ABC transporter substrate-binding protein [Turicibacter sp.]|nr:phosphate/phosphite/phosphonate ABC transporter substrate-binding protein [Turicibacter sp.]
MKNNFFKSFFAVGMAATTAFLLGACGTGATTNDGTIDELTIYFVPSRDPEEIITATEPLREMLIAELAADGFEINNINIQVGTSFEAAGQALHAGSADIGFLPGATYVLFDDGVAAILTATRAGLSKDFENPAAWNDGLPTTNTDNQVMTYRSLILAGPSARGQELAAIVNGGGELTWDDLKDANWGIMSPASPAGFIFPSLWLRENFGQMITDLDRAVPQESFASAFANLVNEQLDVMTVFADGRMGQADNWMEVFGREADIWTEVQVIGVTDPIFNDTISVSRNSDVMTPELISALQRAFIAISETPEGLEVIAIYNHQGYMIADSSNYDVDRAALDMMNEINN